VSPHRLQPLPPFHSHSLRTSRPRRCSRTADRHPGVSRRVCAVPPRAARLVALTAASLCPNITGRVTCLLRNVVSRQRAKPIPPETIVQSANNGRVAYAMPAVLLTVSPVEPLAMFLLRRRRSQPPTIRANSTFRLASRKIPSWTCSHCVFWNRPKMAIRRLTILTKR